MTITKHPTIANLSTAHNAQSNKPVQPSGAQIAKAHHDHDPNPVVPPKSAVPKPAIKPPGPVRTVKKDPGVWDNGLWVPNGLVSSKFDKERIALIGGPGTGKTTGAATFPNIIFADFDHKLPDNVKSIPFWNPEFCDSIVPRKSSKYPANQRDAALEWLKENHDKFSSEQTLCWDSWSMSQNAFNIQQRLDESISTAKDNSYLFWGEKIKYAEEIVGLFKSMKCTLIVTMHETRERNKDGQLTGKVKPVMDGSFKDQLLGHFTDVWRCHRNPVKIDDQGNKVRSGTQNVLEEGLFWQLGGDDIVNCLTNPRLTDAVINRKVKRIPAHYQELQKLYEPTK